MTEICIGIFSVWERTPARRNPPVTVLQLPAQEVGFTNDGKIQAVEIESWLQLQSGHFTMTITGPDGRRQSLGQRRIINTGYGGLELFELLRGEFPDLPCILWSGAASEAIEKSALRSGVSAFLHKPVRPAVLRDEVRRLLDPPLQAG